MIHVLFVCMGNICRSPTAEGIFRAMVEDAGLQEKIAIDAADARRITIGHLRARKVKKRDFEAFDYVLAMDRQNHALLVKACPPGQIDRLHLFLNFAENVTTADVPDPYYGGLDGFDHVLDLIEAGATGLLVEIQTRLKRVRA